MTNMLSHTESVNIFYTLYLYSYFSQVVFLYFGLIFMFRWHNRKKTKYLSFSLLFVFIFLSFSWSSLLWWSIAAMRRWHPIRRRLACSAPVVGNKRQMTIFEQFCTRMENWKGSENCFEGKTLQTVWMYGKVSGGAILSLSHIYRALPSSVLIMFWPMH